MLVECNEEGIGVLRGIGDSCGRDLGQFQVSWIRRHGNFIMVFWGRHRWVDCRDSECKNVGKEEVSKKQDGVRLAVGDAGAEGSSRKWAGCHG